MHYYKERILTMRKIFFIIMLFGLFYLNGCENEPEQELICGPNEENINGVCEIILEPEEIALRDALIYADDMSNYQMDIIIQNGFDLICPTRYSIGGKVIGRIIL